MELLGVLGFVVALVLVVWEVGERLGRRRQPRVLTQVPGRGPGDRIGVQEEPLRFRVRQVDQRRQPGPWSEWTHVRA